MLDIRRLRTVLAIALAGRLDFDPTVDTITAPDGSEVTLVEPVGEVYDDTREAILDWHYWVEQGYQF